MPTPPPDPTPFSPIPSTLEPDADTLMGNSITGLLAGVTQRSSWNGHKATWEPPNEEELKRLFPAYQIECLLGRGGMGIVYKAHDTVLRKTVAIKLLPPVLAEDVQLMARFKREAQIMNSLDHPGIVKVYSFVQTPDGHAYFVMDYVEGKTIHELVQAKEISVRKTLRLIVQVCKALHYLHGMGILHRDIKPSNIIVDQAGDARLLDFGIAGQVEKGAENLTLTGHNPGTPFYMAPELHNGEPPTTSSDIYALGVTFYEMLTGERPHIQAPPPSARSTADSNVDKVVFRALKAQPSARYQNADEMRRDIQRCFRKSKEFRQAIVIAFTIIATAVISMVLLLRPAGGVKTPAKPPLVNETLFDLSPVSSKTVENPVIASPPAPSAPASEEKIELKPQPTLPVVPITSDFEKDADGWTGINNQNQGETLSFRKGGATAASRGFISVSEDRGDKKLSHFAAAAKFLGDKRSAYSGHLRFRLKYYGTTGTWTPYALIVLKSKGRELHFQIHEVPPVAEWTFFDIPLEESPQWINTTTGQKATKEDLLQVLGEIESLWILAEFTGNHHDRADLDDVSLIVGDSQTIPSAADTNVGTQPAVGIPYTTSFESPEFKLGSFGTGKALETQSSRWSLHAEGNGVDLPQLARIQTSVVKSGKQALLIQAEYAKTIKAGVSTTLENTAKVIHFEADIFLASSSTRTVWQFAAGDETAGFVGGVNIAPDDGRFQLITPGYKQTAPAMKRDVWHRLRLNFDVTKQTYQISVNDVVVAADVPFLVKSEKLRVFQFDTFAKGDDLAYLDNLSITEGAAGKSTPADPLAEFTAILRGHGWSYEDSLYPGSNEQPPSPMRFHPNGKFHDHWKWNYWIAAPGVLHVQFWDPVYKPETALVLKFNDARTAYSGQFKDKKGLHRLTGTRLDPIR